VLTQMPAPDPGSSSRWSVMVHHDTSSGHLLTHYLMLCHAVLWPPPLPQMSGPEPGSSSRWSVMVHYDTTSGDLLTNYRMLCHAVLCPPATDARSRARQQQPLECHGPL
jgi:hypothetical protein